MCIARPHWKYMAMEQADGWKEALSFLKKTKGGCGYLNVIIYRKLNKIDTLQLVFRHF